MGDSGGKPDGTIVTLEDRTIANRAHIFDDVQKSRDWMVDGAVGFELLSVSTLSTG